MSDPTNPSARPRLTWRQREARAIRVAVVDPQLVAPGTASPSVYEQDILLVSPAAPPEFSFASRSTADAVVPQSPLHEAASRLGWTLAPEPLEDAPTAARLAGRMRVRPDAIERDADSGDVGAARRSPGVAQTIRMRIGLDPSVGPEVPQVPPDAWRLIVEARKGGAIGIGLNHILSTDDFDETPFKGNPFKGNPFKGNPFKGNPFKGNAGGMDSYGYPGFGGRQPVSFIGADLPNPVLPLSERPVVAILDTGCGSHPWLADRIIPHSEYQGPLGIDDPATDPDVHPTEESPLDGLIDDAAGHGTFIAGIVAQACPEARILPIRVSDGDGVIKENDLLAALGRLVDIVVNVGKRVDVVNLSFSYYHESPESESIDGELYPLLKQLREAGCVIVCSAGNDATDRPASPASLHHWDGPDCGIGDEGNIAPQVTVGALNPSGDSVALFSNVGDWVQTYVRGVSVLSTLPTNFQGSIQADISNSEYARRRQTLDIDDFGDGFAVWSGTSFAAPLIAGRIAAKLAGAAPIGVTAAVLLADRVAAATDASKKVVADAAKEDRSGLVS